MNISNISNITDTRIPEPYQSLLIVFLALIIFLTVAGNLLVILAMVWTPQLQNVSGIFIMSLACADFIVGCVVQPVSSTMLLTRGWLLGNKGCDIFTSVDILCVTASTQMLCAIAGVRYMAVTRPLRYECQYTLLFINNYITSSLVMSILVTFLLSFSVSWIFVCLFHVFVSVLLYTSSMSLCLSVCTLLLFFFFYPFLIKKYLL